MADKFGITDVSTTPHNANQYVMKIGEVVPTVNGAGNGHTIYSRYAGINRAAAFKLIQVPAQPNLFEIPLKILAEFDFKRPGKYYMTAEGSGIKLVSRPFAIDEIRPQSRVTIDGIGPFQAEIAADCPFKVDVEVWRVYRCDTNQKIDQTDSAHIKIYFFLGSTALSLNYTLAQDAHLDELLRLTIPFYADIAGRTWSQLEDTVSKQVVLKLWLLGSRDFHYDAMEGAPSFVTFNPYGFGLGKMLTKARSTLNSAEPGKMLTETRPTCNCVDLAILVYAAFKSFGRRPDHGHAAERDIFDITVHKLENWGLILPSTLFGYQNTSHEYTNSPFFEGKGTDSLVDEKDPTRTGFSMHCFTLLRTSCRGTNVVDICLANPTGDPYPEDESSSHERQDGWCGLHDYLALRDQAWIPVQESDLIDVPVGGFWV